MNIIHHEEIPASELIARLKQVRLKGFDQSLVYKDASLSLVKQFNINLLVPPQRYVLEGTLQAISDVADALETRGVDAFALNGAVYFWTEGMDPEQDKGIPFLPPIVEESTDRFNHPVLLVNDGMHRVSVARNRRRRSDIVLITNVPKQFPYYAYPFTGGWGEVKVFDELPDEFQKKDYRNPDNYKTLFRQFNTVFPGIQEQRKQSNPTHIKE